MEKSKHLYLVSFGDSDRYRIETEEPLSTSADHKHPRLEQLEATVKAFLEKKFPGEPLAYFYTPRVEEISWEHCDQYLGYPLLDDKKLEEIEKQLVNEVEVRNADKTLNNNPTTGFAPPEY